MVRLPREYLVQESGEPMVLNKMYRFSHKECGDRRNRLYVRRIEDGWLCHCHNCAPKVSGFIKDTDGMCPSQIVSVLKRDPNKNPYSLRDKDNFPSDYTEEMSFQALAWIRKYGITNEELNSYHIGYSKKLNKVILPVLDSRNQLLSWQERSLATKGLKYVTRNYSVDGGQMSNLLVHKDYKIITLVEDYISTIKVGRIGSCLCLHGSYINPTLYPMLRKYDQVRIWLDHDKYATSFKFMVQMNRVGIPTTVIDTKGDPKEYGDHFIRIQTTNQDLVWA